MFKANLLFNFLSTVLSRGTLLVITIIMTNNLDESDYGHIAYIRSLLQIFEAGLGITVGVAIGRIIASKGMWSLNYPKIVANVVLFITLLFFALLVVSFLIFYDGKLAILDSVGLKMQVLFLVLIVPVIQLIIYILKSVEKYKQVLNVYSIIFFIGAFISYILTTNYGFSGAITSLVLVAFITLSLLTFVLVRGIQFQQLFTMPFNKNVMNFHDLKVNTFPMVVSSCISPICIWLINYIILSNSIEGSVELAYFNITFLIYNLFLFLPMVVSEVLFPYMNRFRDKAEVNLWVYIPSAALVLYSLLFILVAINFSELLGKIFFESPSALFTEYLTLFAFAGLFSVSLPVLGKYFIAIEKSWWNFSFNVLWSILIFVFYFIVGKGSALSFVYAFLYSYACLFVLQMMFFILITKRKSGAKTNFSS
jgi:O-antigen/teichoic acid export membrane protein